MNQKPVTAGLIELGTLSEIMSAQIDETLVRLAACQERFESSFRRFRIARDTIEALAVASSPTERAAVDGFDLAAD